MKLTSLLFLVFSYSNLCAATSDKPEYANAIVQTINVAQSDTLKVEFNLKKKNLSSLASGKALASLLRFYEFYLQEKDLGRADSLLLALLKPGNVAYRHQISLISYRYTADTRTQRLFLKDRDSIKAYQSYVSKFSSAALKSNGDSWAHYYNLTALDEALYKIAPDSVLRKKMGHHYNSLAWYGILSQKLEGVEDAINQSIKYDPEYKNSYANRALYLLLKGHYQQAKVLYLKFKDLPFDTPGSTFKDVFLEDFKELAAVGIVNEDIRKITALLNSK